MCGSRARQLERALADAEEEPAAVLRAVALLDSLDEGWASLSLQRMLHAVALERAGRD